MITWTCHACHESATERSVLYVLHADVLDAEDSGNFYDWEPARWSVVHLDCQPDPDGPSGYAIDTERITNLADLLWWSGHLMGKSWITATDWPDLIKTESERAAGGHHD